MNSQKSALFLAMSVMALASGVAMAPSALMPTSAEEPCAPRIPGAPGEFTGHVNHKGRSKKTRRQRKEQRS